MPARILKVLYYFKIKILYAVLVCRSQKMCKECRRLLGLLWNKNIFLNFKQILEDLKRFGSIPLNFYFLMTAIWPLFKEFAQLMLKFVVKIWTVIKNL